MKGCGPSCIHFTRVAELGWYIGLDDIFNLYSSSYPQKSVSDIECDQYQVLLDSFPSMNDHQDFGKVQLLWMACDLVRYRMK